MTENRWYLFVGMPTTNTQRTSNLGCLYTVYMSHRRAFRMLCWQTLRIFSKGNSEEKNYIKTDIENIT